MTAAAVLCGMALVARPPAGQTRAPMPRLGGVVSICLAVVVGSLLAVGVVSHTPLRHLVQMLPVMIALRMQVRRSALGALAAAPILAFWFVVMVAIWLFLSGAAHLVTGTFSPVEIALTVLIGAASLVGMIAVFRRGPAGSAALRLTGAAIFGLLQGLAMWISLQPAIASK